MGNPQPVQPDPVPREAEIIGLAADFATTQDLDKLLMQMTGAVERLTNSEAASILLLDDDKKQLVFRVATGDKGSTMKRFYVPIGKGIAGWVAQNGQPVVSNDVANDERFTGQIDKSSGFSTRSILAVPMMVGDQLIGVCEALNKARGGYDEADQRVLENLSTLAAATINNARMAEDHRNFFAQMIEIVTMAVEGGDSNQTGHSYRVAQMSCRIGREMGINGQEYRDLYYAALLHDLGMVAVHDLRFLPSVVSKTIERTPEKLHPLVGAELIKNIRLFRNIAPAIRHHHEFFDGSGHPDGLVGDDIPLAARIICLVECIEDLTNRGLVGEEFMREALAVARSGSGSKFDKRVVDAFISAYTS